MNTDETDFTDYCGELNPFESVKSVFIRG